MFVSVAVSSGWTVPHRLWISHQRDGHSVLIFALLESLCCVALCCAVLRPGQGCVALCCAVLLLQPEICRAESNDGQTDGSIVKGSAADSKGDEEEERKGHR